MKKRVVRLIFLAALIIVLVFFILPGKDKITEPPVRKRLKALKTEAPELVPLTYVWIPDFRKDFLMFNFDNLEEQYKITTEWARNHNPVPLEEYLRPYYHEKKSEFE